MTQQPDIKRWTAKRKAELIRQIYRGQTTRLIRDRPRFIVACRE